VLAVSKDLLLEIGTEEIPAKFMVNTLAQVSELANRIFAEWRLSFSDCKVYGTPRRIALLLHDLADVQADLVKEVRGPAKRAAFDANGNPTKAAEGFARSQGVTPADLIVRSTEQGEYVYATVKQLGQPAAAVLPEVLTELINGISFPKSMRWRHYNFRFARPVRWFVALHGNEIVPLQIEEMRAGRVSQGHRFLAPGPVEIANPATYVEQLRAAFVIVDPAERAAMITQQIKEVAAAHGGQVLEDEDLLNEVNFLVEYPTALCGSFAAEYLCLPKEVLVTTMREHQKYFPVTDANGQLLPLFIAVRNGGTHALDIVREGNEKVLKARLADAKFFYDEDQRRPLAENVEKLKQVVFQEKLGTIYEKVERNIALTNVIVSDLEVNDRVQEIAQRVAYLCKADLVTNMVFEFTELQGVMGREYALLSGEEEEVARGIFEHYLPRFAGDELPQTLAGTAVSIADKIDTIAGCFGVGIIPTGSQDPYALRRQALGIVNMMLSNQLPLSLQKLIRIALAQFKPEVEFTRPVEQVAAEITEFFKQRIRNVYIDLGIRSDVVDGVLASGFDNISDAYRRAQAVMNFVNHPDFAKLIAGFNRVVNLAAKAAQNTIDPALHNETQEKALYRCYLATAEKVQQACAAHDYFAACLNLAGLQEPIDNFFDALMVMVDDTVVRNNRLALLKNISELYLSLADWRQIKANEIL